ncbi:thiolase C-terminal domain-containing protein [Ramlibacter sp.]|uniref:thiolase C-terminal domain-containing protein n=1 Tax=Ramlibacter sp. TaxID=1917967 RepID=UPI003D14DBAE
MADERPPVFIESAALDIGWRDETLNLSELIFRTVKRAIDETPDGIRGIESVVLAAHDLVDGRSLSSMVTAPAAGAYLRDEIRYGDDGAAAFAAAVVRIEAGECTRSIVAAWGRASEHDVDAVSRKLFDPLFQGPLGLDELQVSALRAQAWAQAGGRRDDHARAATRRRDAAAANPRAVRGPTRPVAGTYPLTREDLPVWADIAVAVVLSSKSGPVRVKGMGQASEPYAIGDRDLARMTSARKAAEGALREAGLSPSELDLFEVDGLTLMDEAILLEAVGLAPEGQGLAVLAHDKRVNASGGSAAGYCAPTMGLARIVEATLQIQGRAGAIQQPGVRRALAVGSSLVAAQTHTAIVLEAA